MIEPRMARASSLDPKMAHHLILCAYGACMIGMVESVTISWTGPKDVFIVMGGWLGIGAMVSWPMWLAIRRKPRGITPVVMAVGVCGAGIAAACAPTLRGAFILPALSIAAAIFVLRQHLPDTPTRGYCVSCGYNLRGLNKPRCPECGRAFDPAILAMTTTRPDQD